MTKTLTKSVMQGIRFRNIFFKNASDENTSIVLQRKDICLQICLQFNHKICTSKFPASFKLANVKAGFKDASRDQKDNYRQINILPIIFKPFVKIIS